MDREFSESLRAYHKQKGFEKQKHTTEEEIKRITRQLKDPIFEEFSKLEEKDKHFRLQFTVLEEMKKQIEYFEKVIQGKTAPDLPDTLLTDPALKRTRDELLTLQTYLINNISKQKRQIEKTKESMEVEYKQWEVIFTEKKEQFQEKVLKLGGDVKKLEEVRKIKGKELENIESKLLSLKSKAKRIKESHERRKNMLDKLNEIYNSYTDARKEKCEFFEKYSNGKLKIRVLESSNREEFKKGLSSFKKGSYLRDYEIDQICNNIAPYEFILELLRYDLGRYSKQNGISEYINNIAQNTKLSAEKIKGLADHVLSNKSYEELLLLQYKSFPQDRPEIKYDISNNREKKYELLKNLSTGQKCTAMVMIALSEGKIPVVIDQPEDSLDIRAIWEDMCSKLRVGKELRQFIFTTHNSSVAVASDTDKFTIMEASAARGAVVFSGAIDNEELKAEVMKYLEGGVPTYKLKYLKYNISKKIK